MTWKVTSPAHHTADDDTGVGQLQWTDPDSGRVVTLSATLGTDDNDAVNVLVDGASVTAWSTQ